MVFKIMYERKREEEPGSKALVMRLLDPSFSPLTLTVTMYSMPPTTIMSTESTPMSPMTILMMERK